jgi:hypothetical protein
MMSVMVHRGLTLVALLISCASGDERRVADAWLTCVECSDGELDSLVARALMHPGVVDTLREDLLHGPAPARRARLVTDLKVTYQGLVASRAGDPGAPPLSLDQATYVSRYLEYLLVIYRSRAAFGLAAIGGSAAGQALDAALMLPPDSLPDEMRRRVQFARDSVWQ